MTLDLTDNERALLLAIGRDGLTLRQAARRVLLTYGSARVCMSRIGKRNKVSRDQLLYWLGFQSAVAQGDAFRCCEKSQSKSDELGGLQSHPEGINPPVETWCSHGLGSDRPSQKGPSGEPARNYQVEVLD